MVPQCSLLLLHHLLHLSHGSQSCVKILIIVPNAAGNTMESAQSSGDVKHTQTSRWTARPPTHTHLHGGNMWK